MSGLEKNSTLTKFFSAKVFVSFFTKKIFDKKFETISDELLKACPDLVAIF